MDAATIASLATAGGTLVLALATFSSTRSANRAARVAERSFLAAQRPVLFPAQPEDPPQKIGFVDNRWLRLHDGMGAIEVDGQAIYVAMPVRNAGAGIAVLHGWQVHPERITGRTDPPAVEEFRTLTRDIYIPAGDLGFWQGAIRDPADPLFTPLAESVAGHRAMTADVLYGDHEGAQRTITRFGLMPRLDQATEAITGWICAVTRHWNLDRADPR